MNNQILTSNSMNTLSLVSIAELLDGRFFFIPAYQRGYRWSEDQMLELLDDLYEFAIREKKKPIGDSYGEFYCLQPVIVQRIISNSKIEEIRNITGWGESVTSENTWEVVDGQQRLTSLYILYRYLIEEEIISLKKLSKANMKLYHICYETRPESKDFLQNLSSDSTSDDNIDFAFISNAYNTITTWLDKRGPNLALRYNKRSNPDDILTTINDLLRTRKEDVGEATGSAQFIWYEIAPDSSKNPIDEFVSINNGKIRLTDAELIKGLILQKRNFIGDKAAEQMKIALQWENIENTLHRNDFWNFLSSSTDEDNRIELLFSMRYYLYRKRTETPKDGDLFRFYFNDLLSYSPGITLENAVKQEWKEILRIFDVLLEWYEDPVLYNKIGYLIHSGVNLQTIMEAHRNIPSDASKNDFVRTLDAMIGEKLPSKDDVKGGIIKCSYNKNKSGVRSLLLFLNIFRLNKQIAELRKNNPTFMTPAYKFPFDLYISQDWDVEHIDSATRNDLKEIEQKDEWLHQSMVALEMKEDEELSKWFEEQKYDLIWDKILKRSSNSGDEELKDSIGNLTLLDAQTNRSYHNKIFALKRTEINDAMNEGRFIPVCTQMVFNKSFKKQHVNLREWNDEDKRLYSEFILGELREFYNMQNDQTEITLFSDND